MISLLQYDDVSVLQDELQLPEIPNDDDSGDNNGGGGGATADDDFDDLQAWCFDFFLVYFVTHLSNTIFRRVSMRSRRSDLSKNIPLSFSVTCSAFSIY